MLEVWGLTWWLRPWRVCLQCRRPRFSPWSGRVTGEGNGNPFQYSCQENSMDSGASWGTVHGVTKSQTQMQLSGQKFRKFQENSPIYASQFYRLDSFIMELCLCLPLQFNLKGNETAMITQINRKKLISNFINFILETSIMFYLHWCITFQFVIDFEFISLLRQVKICKFF